MPLLDLMAANHAVKLGSEIPSALKWAMHHRHRMLARRYSYARRRPAQIASQHAQAPAEAAAQHEAEWLARARDVISRYDLSSADGIVRG